MSSYQPGSKFILHVDLDNDSDMICHEKGGFGIKIATGLLVHMYLTYLINGLFCEIKVIVFGLIVKNNM